MTMLLDPVFWEGVTYGMLSTVVMTLVIVTVVSFKWRKKS